MISWVVSIAVVVLFILLFKLFKLVDISKNAIALAIDSVAVVQDRSLTDLEKEKTTQRNALALFKAFFSISVFAMLAVFIPLSLVFLLDSFGIISLTSVLDTLLSVSFLICSALLGGLAIWIGR